VIQGKVMILTTIKTGEIVTLKHVLTGEGHTFIGNMHIPVESDDCGHGEALRNRADPVAVSCFNQLRFFKIG
jgi:hypothetical protein